MLEHGAQIGFYLVGDEVFDEVQGGAAQGKRVVGAFWGQPGRKKTHQAVQTVGQGQGQTGAAMADRRIQFCQCHSNFRRFAGTLGVMSAHDPLE